MAAPVISISEEENAQRDADAEKFVPKRSSQIVQVRYNAKRGVLDVLFVTRGEPDGSFYEYQNVDRILFDELKSAESLGSVFNALIKSNPTRYPCTKVTIKPASVTDTLEDDLKKSAASKREPRIKIER